MIENSHIICIELGVIKLENLGSNRSSTPNELVTTKPNQIEKESGKFKLGITIVLICDCDMSSINTVLFIFLSSF